MADLSFSLETEQLEQVYPQLPPATTTADVDSNVEDFQADFDLDSTYFDLFGESPTDGSLPCPGLTNEDFAFFDSTLEANTGEASIDAQDLFSQPIPLAEWSSLETCTAPQDLTNADLAFFDTVEVNAGAACSTAQDPSSQLLLPVPMEPPVQTLALPDLDASSSSYPDPTLATLPIPPYGASNVEDPAALPAAQKNDKTIPARLDNLPAPPVGMDNVIFSQKRGKWVLSLGPVPPEDFHHSPTLGGYYIPLGSTVSHSVSHPIVPPSRKTGKKTKWTAPALPPPAPYQGQPKVLYNRNQRRADHPFTDPDNIYGNVGDVPEPWGNDGYGAPLFTYNEEGRLKGRMTAGRIRQYIDGFEDSDPFVIWVQHHPSQCTERTSEHKCLWEACPKKNGKFSPGDYQVSFDEYSVKTSDGSRDPFKVAGSMHLYCFEQCFDPVLYYLRGKLQPDARDLPREERNPMSLTIPPCPTMIKEAFRPWMKKAKEGLASDGVLKQPRAHEDTLYRSFYRLARKYEVPARRKRRDQSNAGKTNDKKTTVDVVEGNLKVLCDRATAKARERDAKIDNNADNYFQVDMLAWEAPSSLETLLGKDSIEQPLPSPPASPVRRSGRKRRRPSYDEDEDEESDEEPNKRQRRTSPRDPPRRTSPRRTSPRTSPRISPRRASDAAPVEGRTAQGGILALPQPT